MSRISKRVALSSAAAVVAVGSLAFGSFASATTPSEPTLKGSSAAFTAPSDDAKGALTFTTDAADDSGIKSLKVLAWPAATGLQPTAGEMAHAEEADCDSGEDEKSQCTYTVPVGEQEAEDMERGEWTISALLTTNDGEKKFVPEAASVNVDF